MNHFLRLRHPGKIAFFSLFLWCILSIHWHDATSYIFISTRLSLVEAKFSSSCMCTCLNVLLPEAYPGQLHTDTCWCVADQDWCYYEIKEQPNSKYGICMDMYAWILWWRDWWIDEWESIGIESLTKERPSSCRGAFSHLSLDDLSLTHLIPLATCHGPNHWACGLCYFGTRPTLERAANGWVRIFAK